MLTKRAMRMCFLLLLFIPLLPACSEKPTQSIDLSAMMKDGHKIKVTILFTCADENCPGEILAKKDTLAHGFRIIMRDYRSEKLKGKGRTTVTRILDRLLKSEIRAEIQNFKITHYEIL